MHCVVASLHLKALERFTFLIFLLMLYMQKTGLCVSCYLALYMHKFCVAGPFKYRCYDED